MYNFKLGGKMFTIARLKKDRTIRGLALKKGDWCMFSERRAVAFFYGITGCDGVLLIIRKDGKYVGRWSGGLLDHYCAYYVFAGYVERALEDPRALRLVC